VSQSSRDSGAIEIEVSNDKEKRATLTLQKLPVTFSLLFVVPQSRRTFELKGIPPRSRSVSIAESGNVDTAPPDSTPEDSPQRSIPDTKGIKGHPKQVLCVAFSPDGKYLATGAEDEKVRLWDVNKSQVKRVLSGHTGPVKSVAFCRNGKVLASGAADNTVKLWDTSTFSVLQTLRGHQGEVLSVAFSPDCKVLATGSGDRTLRVWDATTGTVKRVLGSPEKTSSVEEFVSVAFSSDGKTVVGARTYHDGVRTEGQILFHNVDTGALCRTLTVPCHLNAMAISPDGRSVAAGGGQHRASV
jgi:WD40 repeat protein